MNIALIGVPGSGKTSLAYRLRRRIEDVEDCACDPDKRGVALVDDYVSDIELETDLALGRFATYLGNLYVALGRYGRERVARAKKPVVISCGTMIETAVYSAMQFVSLAETLNDEEQIAETPRIDASLRMLAVLYKDIMHYDYAFYLPPKTKVEEDSELMDRQLQVALQGFKLIEVTALTNPETQVDDAIEAMKEHLGAAHPS